MCPIEIFLVKWLGGNMFVLEIIPHKGAYDSDTLVKLLF